VVLLERLSVGFSIIAAVGDREVDPSCEFIEFFLRQFDFLVAGIQHNQPASGTGTARQGDTTVAVLTTDKQSDKNKGIPYLSLDHSYPGLKGNP
jgi:hypothetical protein